jgi:transposase
MLFQKGKPYSQDLRERVFAEANDGAKVGEIATLLRVSISYVSKALSRLERTGERAARPQRGHVQPKLAPLYGAIAEHVKANPDVPYRSCRRCWRKRIR